MTTPDRTIGGLPVRRRPDPKNLISANRQAVDSPPQLAPTFSQSAVGEQVAPAPAPSTPPVVAGPTVEGPVPASTSDPIPSAKHKMSVYVSSELRTALRAAYRATSHAEGDDSFSALVEKALKAELTRREAVHNNGNPFPNAGGKLPSGRPLGN